MPSHMQRSPSLHDNLHVQRWYLSNLLTEETQDGCVFLSSCYCSFSHPQKANNSHLLSSGNRWRTSNSKSCESPEPITEVRASVLLRVASCLNQVSMTCKGSECRKMEETPVERAGKGHSRQRKPKCKALEAEGWACLASEQRGKEERARRVRQACKITSHGSLQAVGRAERPLKSNLKWSEVFEEFSFSDGYWFKDTLRGCAR